MGRRYTEKQTSEILRKAIKLQAIASESEVAEASVFDAAREIGIDEEFVNQAIQELESSPTSFHSGFLGKLNGAERELVVQGELTDDAWESAIAIVASTLRLKGSATQSGSTREWASHNPGAKRTMLRARQAGDSVRVKLTVDTGWAFFLGTVGVCLAGAFALLVAVGLSGVGWVVTYIVLAAMCVLAASFYVALVARNAEAAMPAMVQKIRKVFQKAEPHSLGATPRSTESLPEPLGHLVLCEPATLGQPLDPL